MNLFEFLFIVPTRNLILNAPRFFGGWAGADRPDICMSLSGVPVSHWIGLGKVQCDEIIDRTVISFILTILSVTCISIEIHLCFQLYRFLYDAARHKIKARI